MTSKGSINLLNLEAEKLAATGSVNSVKEMLEMRRTNPFRGFIDLRPQFDKPVTMFCNNDTLTELQLFWNKDFEVEPYSLKIWHDLARGSARVCDVGAHVGIYSMVAAQANRKAKVFAFEAVDYIWARLLVNVHANGLANIEGHHFGVSATNDWAKINVRFGTGILSSGSSMELREATAGTTTPKWIQTVTLDSFFENRPINLIKIDVEDHELSVLQGARRVLSEDRPFILCEILPGSKSAEDTLDLLKFLQYEVCSISEDKHQMEPVTSVEDIRSGGPNFFFLPSERRDEMNKRLDP
jgi:FkbM family methyltransferase